MALTDSGFQTLMAEAVALANRRCQGKVLAILEGGYESQVLARCVTDAIGSLDRAEGIAVKARA